MADDKEDQKLQVAQHFLLSSPPGQFNEVLQDLQKLLPEGLLTNALLANIHRTYNLTHGRIVTDGDRKVLVVKQGEVEGGYLFDSATGKVVAVDHAKGVLLDNDAGAGEAALEPSLAFSRADAARALADYVSSQYNTDSVTSAAYAPKGPPTVHLIIYGEKLNLRNYWSGSWLSAWKVDIDGDQAATISGTIKVRAHYFEEGNVQMQTTKSCPPTALTLTGTADGWVSAAMQTIKDAEQKLQQGLDNMYANMGDETFKAMRRRLTINKVKMEWNMNAHRLARTLGK